jgi:hypothetical protein
MTKITAAALVVLGILTIFGGCGVRHCCCANQVSAPNSSSETLCCPLPPRVPACDGYVAELPPREPVRVARRPATADSDSSGRRERDRAADGSQSLPQE